MNRISESTNGKRSCSPVLIFVCVTLPVVFRGQQVGEFVPDLLVFDSVVADPKVIDRITDHERGQMLNYLRITKMRVGLILNFKRSRLEWEQAQTTTRVWSRAEPLIRTRTPHRARLSLLEREQRNGVKQPIGMAEPCYSHSDRGLLRSL